LKDSPRLALPFSIKSDAHLTQTPEITLPIIQDIMPRMNAKARKVKMKFQSWLHTTFGGPVKSI
jgi:hypothetical protein